MSRVTFRNARGLQLVGDLTPAAGDALGGDLTPAAGDALVVMAHGFASDRGSRGRFAAIAAALAAAGMASLAFDFAGCGESDDDVLTLDHQVDDLHAALAHARSLGYRRLALHGHSLGGRVCLAAAPPRVVTIAATGAPTAAMHYDWRDYFTPAQMSELERTGRAVMPQGEGHARTAVVASAELLEALADCDQAALFGRLRCPVLLIDGDGDDEERQSLANARRGLPLLPPGSRVELLAGSPHSLEGHLELAIALLVDWFAAHLPGAPPAAG